MITATATNLTTNDTSEFSAAPRGLLEFTNATYFNSEGNSGSPNAIIATVRRVNGSAGTITVPIVLSNASGSATAGSDYTNTLPITVTFNDGDTADKTVSIPIVGDMTFEPSETINLQLGTPTGGAALGTQTTATYTIVNDDARPTISVSNDSQTEGNSGTIAETFTVSLSNPSSEGVSVTYNTVDGSATIADGDYEANTGVLTFAPGQISQTIAVNVSGDTKFEADQTFSLNLSNPTNGTLSTTNSSGIGTIVNDDVRPTISIGNVSQNEGNSGTTGYTFTANLSNASDEAVSVSYSTVDGTATVADGDYAATTGALTFAPGQISQTISVNVSGDTKFEADQTFSLNLSNPTNATIATGTSTGTLTNDDAPPVISINNVTHSEGNSGSTAYTFTVSLSNASGEAVTVDYATADNTATTANSDYTAANGSLTFAPGNTSKTITINITGDRTYEPINTFQVALSNPTGATLGTNSTGTGTIINDDDAYRPDFDGDGTAEILWRNSASGDNITWQMNGTTLSTFTFLPQVADKNWSIQGIGDFNADGKSDLLWRNSASGDNVIWQMNGTSVSTIAFLTRVADLNWQIQKVGDFTGDGQADIVWRNSASGDNVIWQMNGTTLSTFTFLPPVADRNWTIQGLSDFDGNGTPDLLWRNLASGDNIIWQMNGTTFSTLTYLPPVADRNWTIRGISSFNSSSTPDLLWRNSASGEDIIWRLNGTTFSTLSFLPQVADTNWRII